ncbi:alcohol dehydrogenase catalytic domain-containing protein, partial [Staphylococcus simulans]
MGDFSVKEPLILGHEVAGVGAAVGEDVTKLSVGDRGAVEPCVPCGKCEQCQKGKYNLCHDGEFLAKTTIEGALEQDIEHPENFVCQIPEYKSYEKASIKEPLTECRLYKSDAAQQEEGGDVAGGRRGKKKNKITK